MPTVRAVDQNGAFKPKVPATLPEGREVTIDLTESAIDRPLDTEYHAECEADASPVPTLAEVRAALAVLPGDVTADFATERDER
jgi:predicted DNA-binding antitoxin AbrB/MazE fold protein